MILIRLIKVPYKYGVLTPFSCYLVYYYIPLSNYTTPLPLPLPLPHCHYHDWPTPLSREEVVMAAASWALQLSPPQDYSGSRQCSGAANAAAKTA